MDEKMATLNKDKICPLRSNKCIEDKCAWWSSYCKTCAIHNLESIEK